MAGLTHRNPFPPILLKESKAPKIHSLPTVLPAWICRHRGNRIQERSNPRMGERSRGQEALKEEKGLAAEPMGAVGLAGDPEAVVADRADVVLRRHGRRRRGGAHALPSSPLAETRVARGPPAVFLVKSSVTEKSFVRPRGAGSFDSRHRRSIMIKLLFSRAAAKLKR
jgi:hypothetical protein